MASLAVACELLVVACGFWCPEQELNPAHPAVGAQSLKCYCQGKLETGIISFYNKSLICCDLQKNLEVPTVGEGSVCC